MPAERERCDTIQARLSEAFLARATPAPGDLAHCAACAACAAHRAALDAFARRLAVAPDVEPPEALARVAKRRAAAALREAAASGAVATGAAAPGGAWRELPAGFRRELVRLFAGSLAALPVVLLANAAVLLLAGRLLEPLLPEPVRAALAAAYALAFAGCLSVVYGSLPILAYRRTRGSVEG